MSGAFRLGVVLRLRELAEDQARARLGGALARQRAATEQLVVLVDRETTAQRTLIELQAGGAEAGDILATARAVERAHAAVADGRRALELATAALLEARAALAEASRRREVVERLRDRTRLAEAVEAQRREDTLLSEIAGVRHARGMAAETER